METLCIGRGEQYVRGARVDEGRLSSGEPHGFIVKARIVDWNFPSPIVDCFGKTQIVVKFGGIVAAKGDLAVSGAIKASLKMNTNEVFRQTCLLVQGLHDSLSTQCVGR